MVEDFRSHLVRRQNDISGVTEDDDAPGCTIRLSSELPSSGWPRPSEMRMFGSRKTPRTTHFFAQKYGVVPRKKERVRTCASLMHPAPLLCTCVASQQNILRFVHRSSGLTPCALVQQQGQHRRSCELHRSDTLVSATHIYLLRARPRVSEAPLARNRE